MSCRTCNDPSLVDYESSSGGYICTGCGVVLSQSLVAENDVYPDKDAVYIDNSLGCSASLSASAPSSKIPIQRSLSGRRDSAFRFSRIYRICQVLSLPASSARAVVNLSSNLPTISIANDAACIYSICRRLGRSVTLAEVCSSSNISTRRAGRALRQLKATCQSTDYARFVSKAVKALDCDFRVEKRALIVLEFVSRHGIFSGMKPQLVAFAAVAIMAKADGHATPIETLSAKCSICSRTVLNRMLDMQKVFVKFAKKLPFGIVITSRNLFQSLNMIVDYLPVLDELDGGQGQSDPCTLAKEYADTLSRLGPRRPYEPTILADDSGSDLESLSDNECSIYIRSDKEIEDAILINQRIGRF
uniref:TFIIB-type domain-containing protein n=1 Tax=Spongospora subterranea TaxID=70186 RepID=A0A0H5RMY3_9EUKA|eukprot:CRZ10099.1 hypothetical protein [Spongospora subterranea]